MFKHIKIEAKILDTPLHAQKSEQAHEELKMHALLT
jgi:hypothetical protein